MKLQEYSGSIWPLYEEETAMSDKKIILHGVKLSGHVHRVELLLRMLGLPYAFAEASREVRGTSEFLQLNPLGQIPVLEDGEFALADSNAIMVYIVKRYAPGGSWLPEDPMIAGCVQRWLSIAAGEVMHGPSMARAIKHFGYPGDGDRAAKIAARALRFMDAHLADHSFLAADHATIADLACYSYVAHAPEGGISLEPYPHVQAWLKRVEALPHFFAMPALPIPEAA
jgi:glutathione S-transferase